MAPNMSLFSVHAVLILCTADSSRVLAKYYSPPHRAGGGAPHPHPHPHPHPPPPPPAGAQPYASVADQKAFEKGLVDKTAKPGGGDVILYDNRVVVFKAEADVALYVVGGAGENEVMLYNVVLALRDALNILLKNSVDKRTLLENYDVAALCVDEIVDDGIILDTDPVVVAARVSRPPQPDIPNMQGIDLSEEGLLKIYQFGKQKLGERLRQGL